MNYGIRFVDGASGAITHLPPEIKKAVRKAIRFLSENPYGGEALKWDLQGKRKFRVGRYRVIHQVDSHERIVIIFAVGHRRVIYDWLK
ncbi:MAG: type II toxin-antitoxin system RelE/ParE family toxin [Candidatus Omnitrophica bacterium]|nr:type II toxin-antitoxin system RelE/ParE family toxin [Candidatus Omnitrophota bacterium]